jgi:uncharacterized protein
MWQLSQFTVVRDLAERDLITHNLVFNTSTNKCIVVRKDDWARLINSMASGAVEDEDVERGLAKLAADRFIIPHEHDEASPFRTRLDQVRRNPTRIFPLIAVTSVCNIACTYCYEEGVTGSHMSDEVVDGVLRWFERRIVEDKITGVHPGLFGGEPLMRPRTLFRVMDGLNLLAARFGVETSYYCSSNGVLLTDELAAELAGKGLARIQISLDGPADMHDARRVGKRGQGTFRQSMAAIHRALAHIPQVTVKVNFDRQNRHHIAEVFDQLVTEGIAGQVDVKLEAIAHQFPDSTVRHNRSYPIPPDTPELADAYVALMLEARGRGIRVSRDTAHTTPCMFTSEHGVLIGPDGSIYKCISFVGRPEYAVGSVLDNDYDRDAYDDQMNVYKRTEDCFRERCAYLPVCGGGCAYESAVRTGRYDRRFCTKPYLAEFHFKRHLLQNRKALEKLGMRPISAKELAGSAESAPEQATAGSAQTFVPVTALFRRPEAAGPSSGDCSCS